MRKMLLHIWNDFKSGTEERSSKSRNGVMIYLGVGCQKTSLLRARFVWVGGLVAVVKVRRPEVDGEGTFVSLKCEA